MQTWRFACLRAIMTVIETAVYSTDIRDRRSAKRLVSFWHSIPEL